MVGKDLIMDDKWTWIPKERSVDGWEKKLDFYYIWMGEKWTERMKIEGDWTRFCDGVGINIEINKGREGWEIKSRDEQGMRGMKSKK